MDCRAISRVPCGPVARRGEADPRRRGERLARPAVGAGLGPAASALSVRVEMPGRTPSARRDSPVSGAVRPWRSCLPWWPVSILVTALVGTELPIAKPPSVTAPKRGRLLSFYRLPAALPYRKSRAIRAVSRAAFAVRHGTAGGADRDAARFCRPRRFFTPWHRRVPWRTRADPSAPVGTCLAIGGQHVLPWWEGSARPRRNRRPDNPMRLVLRRG